MLVAMKTLLCHLLRLVLFAASLGTAQARPWWFPLDDSGDNFPARYGYDVIRSDGRDGVSSFSITVDAVAAGLLQSAALVGGKEEDQPVTLSEPDAEGRRKMEISMPTADLPARSLRLNSGPLPFSGHEHLDNFQGYSLLLASVRECLDAEAMSRFSVVARRTGEQLDFAVYLPGRGFEISSRDPRWEVISCTLEGAIGGGRVVIPLSIVAPLVLPEINIVGAPIQGVPQREARFTLPASQISGLILKIGLSQQSVALPWPTTTPRAPASEVRVGLARIAAGAK